jgi:hypothetical protein
MNWSCIFVDEAGNWESGTADKDRAIILAFLPSTNTLGDLVDTHGDLLKTFHASEERSPRVRAQKLNRMRDLVQDLCRQQKAAFAVGRIPAARWPEYHTFGDILWAALIARLVAVYLPFAQDRIWVAIEDRLVGEGLWEFYRHAVRLQWWEMCFRIRRPDRAHDPWGLGLCVYAKRRKGLTHHEGHLNQSRKGGSIEQVAQWFPNLGGGGAVPTDHIRCGLSLPDFIGYVMVSGKEVTQWQEQLKPLICTIDLTEFQL